MCDALHIILCLQGAFQQLYSVQCGNPLIDLRVLSSIQCCSVPASCSEKVNSNLTEVFKKVVRVVATWKRAIQLQCIKQWNLRLFHNPWAKGLYRCWSRNFTWVGGWLLTLYNAGLGWVGVVIMICTDRWMKGGWLPTPSITRPLPLDQPLGQYLVSSW